MVGTVRCQGGAGPALGSGGGSARLAVSCCRTCVGIVVGTAASGSMASNDTSD